MDNTINSLVSQAVSSGGTAGNTNVIDKLTQQILATSDPTKWSGQGFGSAQANAADMAKILANTGISDISQFGQITKQIPSSIIGYDENGNAVESGPQTVTTYGNKLTGQDVGNTYGERQTGNAFGGTYAGSGNTGYRAEFDAQGNPIFYTTGASSSDVPSWVKPALLGAGLYFGLGGLEGLGLGGGTGAGSAFELANAGAGAFEGGSSLGSLGSLGTVGADYGLGTGVGGVAGMGTGTGITSGYSGLGLNAGTAGLGAEGLGAGITAGSGLTGTGVLSGSTLGEGLLGSSALNNLTGTGVLSGSDLGTSLLGTGANTALTGTGILSGSDLGTSLLGSGIGSAVTGGVGNSGTLLGTGLGGSGTGTLLTGGGTGGGVGGLGGGTSSLLGTGTGLGLSALGNVLGTAANQSGISDARNLINQYGTQAQGNLAKAYADAQALNSANRADLASNYANTQGQLGNIYNQQVGFQQPYQAVGQSGSQGLIENQPYFTHQFDANDLNTNLAPNYAFQLQQGQMANQRAGNAAGGALGGNALQGLQRYTQDYAGNAYQQAFNNYNTQRNNIYNSLAGMAGIGQTSAGQLAGLGNTYGSNLGGLSSNYGGNITNAAGQGINAANAYGLNTANLATGIGSALASNATQTGANNASLLSNLGNTALLGSMIKAT